MLHTIINLEDIFYNPDNFGDNSSDFIPISDLNPEKTGMGLTVESTSPYAYMELMKKSDNIKSFIM